jgi:hypothetical protein
MIEARSDFDSMAARESRARRSAKRVGLMARKSRRRLGTSDNHGGFTLIDPLHNTVIAGVRCDMSPEDVIAYCNDEPTAGSVFV